MWSIVHNTGRKFTEGSRTTRNGDEHRTLNRRAVRSEKAIISAGRTDTNSIIRLGAVRTHINILLSVEGKYNIYGIPFPV